jgi:hypothetical protein
MNLTTGHRHHSERSERRCIQKRKVSQQPSQRLGGPFGTPPRLPYVLQPYFDGFQTCLRLTEARTGELLFPNFAVALRGTLTT